MKITKVTIHNYRSIKHCEVECRNILVLLGQNNHGKSNVLRAIEFALTSSAKPTKKDLHAFHNPEDESIWVELVFGQLSQSLIVDLSTIFHCMLRSRMLLVSSILYFMMKIH